MMSKKDYVAIAAALKSCRKIPHDVYDEREEGLDLAAFSIANVLADDNPRFNREKFLKACGVYE